MQRNYLFIVLSITRPSFDLQWKQSHILVCHEKRKYFVSWKCYVKLTMFQIFSTKKFKRSKHFKYRKWSFCFWYTAKRSRTKWIFQISSQYLILTDKSICFRTHVYKSLCISKGNMLISSWKSWGVSFQQGTAIRSRCERNNISGLTSESTTVVLSSMSHR